MVRSTRRRRLVRRGGRPTATATAAATASSSERRRRTIARRARHVQQYMALIEKYRDELEKFKSHCNGMQNGVLTYAIVDDWVNDIRTLKNIHDDILVAWEDLTPEEKTDNAKDAKNKHQTHLAEKNKLKDEFESRIRSYIDDNPSYSFPRF